MNMTLGYMGIAGDGAAIPDQPARVDNVAKAAAEAFFTDCAGFRPCPYSTLGKALPVDTDYDVLGARLGAALGWELIALSADMTFGEVYAPLLAMTAVFGIEPRLRSAPNA